MLGCETILYREMPQATCHEHDTCVKGIATILFSFDLSIMIGFIIYHMTLIVCTVGVGVFLDF